MGYAKTKRSGNKSAMKKKYRKAKGKNKRQDQRLKRLEDHIYPSIEYKYTSWFVNQSLLSFIEPRVYELTSMVINPDPIGPDAYERIGNKLTCKYIRLAMRFQNIRSSQQIRCLVVQFPVMEHLIQNRLLNYIIEEIPTSSGQPLEEGVIEDAGASIDTYKDQLNDKSANRCMIGCLKTDSTINYTILDDFRVSTSQTNEVNVVAQNDGDTAIVTKIYKPKKCQIEYPWVEQGSTSPSACKNAIVLFIINTDASTGSNRLSVDVSYRMKYYDL